MTRFSTYPAADGGAGEKYRALVDEQDQRGAAETRAWYDEQAQAAHVAVDGIIAAARARWGLAPEAQVLHTSSDVATEPAVDMTVGRVEPLEVHVAA